MSLKIRKQELQRIFSLFDDLKVLIIGDSMIDKYLWGKVTRISPEAPVPIVEVDETENRLGGAANVALNVQALGATPILCSVIGVDKNADLFLELMRKQKLTTKGILKCRGRITTTKTRVISGDHQLLRVDEEDDYDISTAETEQLLIVITHLIKHEKIDVIIFEDYDKGMITRPLIQRVVELAKQRSIPTVVDPKKEHFHSYKGVTLFKPNLKELTEGIKEEFNARNVKDLQRVVTGFRVRHKIDNVLVTLSEKGIYINNKKVKALIPAHIRNIADVSGAGDTVVSVAALCLALNLKPQLIAILANLAGGIVCESVGVVSIDKERLLSEALELNIVRK